MGEEKEHIHISIKGMRPKIGLFIQILVSAFIIVSIVFSAMFLLAKKGSENLLKAEQENARLKEEADSKVAVPVLQCAIEIKDILAGDKIAFPISLSGTINSEISNSCGWILYESVAGNIKIIDIKGNIIAGPEQIKLEDAWLDLLLIQKPISWISGLNQIYEPQTTDGIIRFESTSPASGEVKYKFDLPVKF